jgi:hypothetical protein
MTQLNSLDILAFTGCGIGIVIAGLADTQLHSYITENDVRMKKGTDTDVQHVTVLICFCREKAYNFVVPWRLEILSASKLLWGAGKSSGKINEYITKASTVILVVNWIARSKCWPTVDSCGCPVQLIRTLGGNRLLSCSNLLT